MAEGLEIERASAAKEGWWPERMVAFGVLGLIFLSLMAALRIPTQDMPGSDFKTLYASSWCLAHGVDAYKIADIANVFKANHVVLPPTWYGHAPVYPLFTLVLLTPFTWVSMTAAVYLWTALSAVAVACAAAALARVAGEVFEVRRGLRLLMIAMIGFSPITLFGLIVGNPSIMVFPLCTLAITTPHTSTNFGRWLRAAGLAVALLLKPHLAIWVIVALLFLRDKEDRRTAVRAIAIGACLAMVLVAGVAVQQGLGHQLASYQATLHGEFTGGSNDVMQRDVLAPPVQVNSLGFLVGYWLPSGVMTRLLVEGAVLSMLAVLFWGTRRITAEIGSERYVLIGAWCAVGLLATYHRAHDGEVLMLLLPWIFGRLQRSWVDASGWLALLLVALMSFGLHHQTMDGLLEVPAWHAVAQILLYRQAAAATVLLAVTLLVVVIRLAQKEPVAEAAGPFELSESTSFS